MSNSDNLNRMLAEAVAAEIRKDAFWLEYNLKIDTLIKSGRSGLQDGSKVLAAAYTGGGSVVVAEIVAQGIDAFMEEMLDVHLSPDFYSTGYTTDQIDRIHAAIDAIYAIADAEAAKIYPPEEAARIEAWVGENSTRSSIEINALDLAGIVIEASENALDARYKHEDKVGQVSEYRAMHPDRLETPYYLGLEAEEARLEALSIEYAVLANEIDSNMSYFLNHLPEVYLNADGELNLDLLSRQELTDLDTSLKSLTADIKALIPQWQGGDDPRYEWTTDYFEADAPYTTTWITNPTTVSRSTAAVEWTTEYLESEAPRPTSKTTTWTTTQTDSVPVLAEETTSHTSRWTTSQTTAMPPVLVSRSTARVVAKSTAASHTTSQGTSKTTNWTTAYSTALAPQVVSKSTAKTTSVSTATSRSTNRTESRSTSWSTNLAGYTTHFGTGFATAGTTGSSWSTNRSTSWSTSKSTSFSTRKTTRRSTGGRGYGWTTSFSTSKSTSRSTSFTTSRATSSVTGTSWSTNKSTSRGTSKTTTPSASTNRVTSWSVGYTTNFTKSTDRSTAGTTSWTTRPMRSTSNTTGKPTSWLASFTTRYQRSTDYATTGSTSWMSATADRTTSWEASATVSQTTAWMTTRSSSFDRSTSQTTSYISYGSHTTSHSTANYWDTSWIEGDTVGRITYPIHATSRSTDGINPPSGAETTPVERGAPQMANQSRAQATSWTTSAVSAELAGGANRPVDKLMSSRANSVSSWITSRTTVSTTSRSTRKGWFRRKTTRWSTSAITSWMTSDGAGARTGAVAENSGDALVRSAQAFDRSMASTALVQSTSFADRWDLYGVEVNADGAQLERAESLGSSNPSSELNPIGGSSYGHLDSLGVNQSFDQWVLPNETNAEEPDVGGPGMAMLTIEAVMDADAEADVTQVPRRDPDLYLGYDT